MDYFGASVAGVGDVDGDGMEDMVVGALGDDEAALNAGTRSVCRVCMNASILDRRCARSGVIQLADPPPLSTRNT